MALRRIFTTIRSPISASPILPLTILLLVTIRITMQRLVLTAESDMSFRSTCLFPIELHVYEGEQKRKRMQYREYYRRDLHISNNNSYAGLKTTK
jgi:hypothetical protein